MVQKTPGGYIIGDNTGNLCRCEALHGTLVSWEVSQRFNLRSRQISLTFRTNSLAWKRLKSRDSRWNGTLIAIKNFGYPPEKPLYFDNNKNEAHWIIFKWLIQSHRPRTGTLNSYSNFCFKNQNQIHSHILFPLTSSSLRRDSMHKVESSQLCTWGPRLALLLNWDRPSAELK